MPVDVPSQIKPYLGQIADRLWSNNAAVMVGAGFSRNAKPVGSTSASFPSWQELGDRFFEKLRGHRPREGARYLSILKLAEQVEAAFGRPALNQLLRNAIPDLRYEPSPLHSQLLSLPWKDVFTTNYDTLLDRARTSMTFKNYDIVTTKEDLLYANQPRIIKLHGSFPSPPFVITEEDYRRYPNDNAPFVNTVRQSLLENTLCLIGFSGDDPNFLQWIGWIRDHIGKETAPKIYLVGMFSTLGEGDRKLLDRRSIVVVDLSTFKTNDGKALGPGEALGEFLNCLKSRETRSLDWPTVSAGAPGRSSDPSKYHEVVAEWRRQRGEYPGWVVIPKDRRRFLWLYTEQWLLLIYKMSSENRNQLAAPLDLDLAFELAWRLDRCLFPLIGSLPSFLEDVANKYSDEMLQLPKSTHWTTTSILKAVINIRLWLLRYYREQGLDDKWQKVRQAIQSDSEKLLPEHKARFHLEEVCHALFCFNPDEAKRLLVNWQSNDSLPFWEAKRAALMAELGEVAAARSILETSLASVRQQLSLNPVIEDYTLVSQESIIMLLLWGVERSMNLTVSDLENSDSEMSERWRDLAQYKCDPRREIELLSVRLQHPAVSWQPERETHCFDLGIISQTFHSGFDKEAVIAYRILRMHEDIGIYYRIGHAVFEQATVESTLSRIRPYSPHWALANIIRLGSAKATDGLFNREYLSSLSLEEVDRLFEIYLPAFERTIAMVDESDLSKAKNFESLAKTLPDILSRLCYKCSPDYRERLVRSLQAIYGSRRREMFVEVGQFAKRLFESMSVEERTRTVPLLIDFPVPDCLNEIEEQEFVNPVRQIRLPASLSKETLCITEERIDKLLLRYQLSATNQDRNWTMTSLVWLYWCDKLNQHQSDLLGRLLWDGIGTSGLPVVTGYYNSQCIELPHPENVDPKPRVKEYLKYSLSTHTENISSNALNSILRELHCSARVVQWTSVEAAELVKVLLEWWNKYKHELVQYPPMLLRSPATITIRNVIYALSEVFLYLLADNNDEGIELLREFRKELSAQHIPAKVLDAVALSKIPESRKKLLEQVAEALLDNDDNILSDALWAARVLSRQFADEEPPKEFDFVVTTLVQGVQWRHRPALTDRLGVITNLVKNKKQRRLILPALPNLLAGLEHIVQETTSNRIRGNDEDGVITIRAAAASLAFALFEYYQDSGLNEPKAIQRWRDVCSDLNEFSDVKNSWPVVGR